MSYCIMSYLPWYQTSPNMDMSRSGLTMAFHTRDLTAAKNKHMSTCTTKDKVRVKVRQMSRSLIDKINCNERHEKNLKLNWVLEMIRLLKKTTLAGLI